MITIIGLMICIKEVYTWNIIELKQFTRHKSLASLERYLHLFEGLGSF
jgi:hypothetical protein